MRSTYDDGAVVVDLAMEEGRGWELLYAMPPFPGTVVIAVDRTGDGLVRRGALAAGADDVVGPPFDADELVARARAVERRQRLEPAAAPVLRHRDLIVDLAAHEVRIAGRPVALTPQQFEILRALCEARGATLHRSQLLARIAAIEDEPPSERAIDDLHVSRLRRRLGAAGRGYVDSVYGIGYRLAAPAAPAALPAEAARAVIDVIEEGLLVVDAALRIVAANPAATRILGREDLVGRRARRSSGAARAMARRSPVRAASAARC